jgi:hypothetical protein
MESAAIGGESRTQKRVFVSCTCRQTLARPAKCVNSRTIQPSVTPVPNQDATGKKGFLSQWPFLAPCSAVLAGPGTESNLQESS